MNDSENPVVAVIMSSYNGEKYIAEQIDSILAQKGVHTELFIRDDGSKDTTREIITDYVNQYSNIHSNFGQNLGWIESFLHELEAAPEFKYYAFSDHDDVWMPEKLITAVKAIQQEEARRGTDTPIVWQCNCLVTDEKLNVKRKTISHKRKRTMESMILRVNARGCVMVFNAKVRELIMTHGHLAGGHDTVALLHTYASGGSVLFDPQALIFYRQRGDNLAQTPTSLLKMVRSELRNLKGFKGFGGEVSRAVLEAYGDELDPAMRKNLILVIEHSDNFFARLKIVFSPAFSTGILRATILAKFKAFMGWL